MQTWLHFVGRQYYTRRSFIREAEQYGVSRRVSLRELKRMNWRDRVVVAIMEGKSAVVFGRFEIERLAGLSAAAQAAIREALGGEIVDEGGGLVKRGCGMYYQGPTFVTPASLPEIAGLLEELKAQGVDIGRPMVAGAFTETPSVRLKDVPHRQGFRLFDYEKFRAAAAEALYKQALADKRGMPAVRGQFYAEPALAEEATGGEIQAAENYRRKEEIEATA